MRRYDGRRARLDVRIGLSQRNALFHDSAELATLAALADRQSAVDLAVHAAVALAIDASKDEAILAFALLDHEEPAFQIVRREPAFVAPSAVRVAVALEINRARSRLPLAVIGEAVELTADEN